MADSSVNRVKFERALQREQTRQKRYRQRGQHQELPWNGQMSEKHDLKDLCTELAEIWDFWHFMSYSCDKPKNSQMSKEHDFWNLSTILAEIWNLWHFQLIKL